MDSLHQEPKKGHTQLKGHFLHGLVQSSNLATGLQEGREQVFSTLAVAVGGKEVFFY